MRVCSVPGCPTVYQGDTTRCPAHETAAKQKHWNNTKAYNTKAHRITFRAAVLHRDPICVICNAAEATVADHYPLSRTELTNQGLNPNDPRYGRGLCKTHHDQETAKHQPGGWNTH